MAKRILVQTLLPSEVATFVKRKAREEGLSVAAYLRMLLVQKKAEVEHASQQAVKALTPLNPEHNRYKKLHAQIGRDISD